MVFIDACELTVSISALAVSLSKNLSHDELAMLAAITTQLGDTLATILTQRELCEKKEENIGPPV